MVATNVIEHGDPLTAQQNFYGEMRFLPEGGSDGGVIIESGPGQTQAFLVRNAAGEFFAVDTTESAEVIAIRTPGGLRLEGDAGVAGHAVRTLIQVATNSGVLAEGATFTFTGAIPAGARLISVTARVGSVIVGPTTWDLGIAGGDTTRWGTLLSLSGGTQVGVADYTNTGAFEQDLFPVATDILATAVGGDFSAGTIGIVVQYEIITPPVN
jgi:hypothetical protein